MFSSAFAAHNLKLVNYFLNEITRKSRLAGENNRGDIKGDYLSYHRLFIKEMAHSHANTVSYIHVIVFVLNMDKVVSNAHSGRSDNAFNKTEIRTHPISRVPDLCACLNSQKILSFLIYFSTKSTKSSKNDLTSVTL